MDFYFTDRSFNLLEIISTDGSTSIELANEEDKVSIENGNRTLSGTLYFDKKNSVHTKEVGAVGNYILYHDKNQKDVWMTIVEMEHNPKAGTHDFVAEDAGLDLLNELLGPFSADKAYPISYYIEKFTFDSGFELGLNEIPNLTRKLEWEGESTTALARLVSVATQFDNAEIEFSFDISGTTVIKKYVNIYKKRGKDNRQTLYVNVDIDNIIVKSDIYELATALYVEGGTPEGENSPITLKGYQWTDPDNRFELTASSGILKDKVNGAKWSRLLPGEANKNGAYIVRRKTYETTSQKTLLDNALRELKKVSEPAANYEVDILQLPEGIQEGDTIYLVDENEEVYLSARVLELTYQYSISSYKATLGDYLIKDAGISQSLIDLANQLQEQANKKTYKVVLEPTATQFIDGKGSIDIRAKVLDGTLDVSTNFSEYHWTRIDGQGNNDTDWSKTTNKITILPDEQPLWTYICEVSKILEDSSFVVGSDRVTISSISNGSTGIPGPKGEDGKTSYFHIAYASDEKGTNFSTDDPSGRGYMGTYTDFELVDSSDWQKYAWQKVEGEKGVDGLQGEKGDQGIAGPKGEDGKTQYTHIAYADNANGGGFSQDPANKNYIGMYVDFVAEDSTDPKKYKWQLTKGVAGDQGIAGKPGADGKTPYFHTAWADSKDGKTNFSTTDSTNRGYIGTYTDFVENDSTDPTKYTWTELVGALDINSVNYALESRFENLSIQGGTGNYRRKHIALSETIKKDNKVQFSFKWTNISGTAPTKISVVMWGTAQASAVQTFSVSGATGNISGSAVLTNDASFIYIYMGEYAQPDNNELQLEFITVNKGDKLSGWTPSPVDKVELNNLLFNSTWNLGGWGWDNNNTPNLNTSYFEKVAAEIDKPNSAVLHGKPNAATTQQIRSNPYLPVKAGMLIHIKFDYRENSLGNTGGNPFLSIRNFPEPDTANAQANALEYWYFRRNDTPDPTKVWSNWTRFEIYCKITQDGYLSIQPYDGSNTGTHETWYREIMVTAGGSLQGDWSANYNDFQTQIDDNKNTVEGIPKVYMQANTPVGMKDGDMWWKMSSNLVAGYYVYGNNKWNPQSIDQAILNIVQLNAVTINGSTINGNTITGGSFTQNFDEPSPDEPFDHLWLRGDTKLAGGTINHKAEFYKYENGTIGTHQGWGTNTISRGKFIAQKILKDGTNPLTEYSTAQIDGGKLTLTLNDGVTPYVFSGTLDAKSLTRMPWKNLAMNSKFETKENNPPQYKIVYQLDGTKLIKFRGQFGLKTGQMLSNTTYYPFQDGTGTSASGTSYIPVEIRPDRTSFGYGAGPKEGGRLAMTTTPRFVANPAANADYLGMDAFQYIIE